MIRLMESKDIEGVAELEKECFSMPWSAASLQKELDNENSIFCVCEMDGTIVGYAGLYLVPPEGDITNVAVTALYRGRGIAKQLLETLFEQAAKKGITEFTLEVRVSNEPAICLYEKMGFRSEGIRKNFYDAPKEDACIMWKR